MQREARHGSIHLMYFRVLLSILLSQISQTHRFVKRIGVHLLSLIACSWIRELNPQHSDKVRNKGSIFAWKNGESAFNENRKWSGWAKEWIKSGNLTGEMKQFWHYENVFCSTIVINAIYLIWTNDNEHTDEITTDQQQNTSCPYLWGKEYARAKCLSCFEYPLQTIGRENRATPNDRVQKQKQSDIMLRSADSSGAISLLTIRSDGMFHRIGASHMMTTSPQNAHKWNRFRRKK